MATASANPLAYAVDGSYTTRWASSISSSGAFAAAKSTTSALCPVTGATASTTCNPSLIVDLGSIEPVQEIDLSQYMVKGSEPYYTYKIAYSSDRTNWNTLDYTSYATGNNTTVSNIGVVPFSNNITYGFNSLPVNFSARYVALIQTGAITQNNSSSPYNSFYVPNLYEIGIIASTAPASPQQATVTVTPSTSTPATDSSFTVAVAVSGPSGQPTPTGYVQLSTPEYVSETYGLVNGAMSFTIPAGALTGGDEAIAVNYRPDSTSAPIYGISTTSGASPVAVSAPDTPAGLALAQTMPGTLGVSWTASIGASSYVLRRSSDGWATSNQVAAPTGVSFSNTGLNNDSTTYCYEVAAVNGAGAGAYSSPVCSMATANFPVTGVTVTQTAPGGLTIAYTAISSASSYILQRSVAGSAYAQVGTSTTTSYIDNGLTPNSVTYCYTVAAVFTTGTATTSSPVCNTASLNFIPSSLAVTKWASGSLRLTWITSGSGTDTYTVKRAMDGGTYSTLTTTAAAPQYVDSGLNNDSDVYCYTVAETQNAVTGADSAPVCNTPTSKFISIANYSFESPSVPLWSTGPSAMTAALASWTFVGASGSSSGNNSGISNQASGTWSNKNGGGVSALGVQMGYIEEAGSIAQSISGFTSGQQYTMLVAASQRQSVSQTANPLAFSVAGTTIGTAAPPQSNAYFVDYGFNFTASSTSQLIALTGTSSSSTSAVLVDNVRIFPSSGSAVTAAQSVATVTLTEGQSSINVTPVVGGGGATTLFYNIYPSLPSGLSFSTTTGLMTGSPMATSSAVTYTVTVGDNEGGTASAAFTLAVNSPVTAAVNTASVALTVDSAATPFVPVSGAYGTTPLSYAISPALPSGLTMASSTGALSGTPIAVSSSTSYTVIITDSNGVQAQGGFALGVQAIAPTLSISCSEVTYDGKAHSCIGTATDANGNAVSGNWSFNPSSVTAAGSTTVAGTFTSSNGLYASGGTANATLVIDKAPATVTPTVATKVYGASDPAFTGTLSGFVAGDNVIATYSRTQGESVVGGPYTISATLSPAGVLGNYSITYNSAAFTITQASQTITFTPAISTYAYSSGSFALSAAASSGLVVNFASTTASTCSVSGSTVTILAAGNCGIQASQGGNANYSAASAVTRTFTLTSGATNVTSSVSIVSSGLVYSRVSQIYTGTLTIKNIGAKAIGSPLQIVLTGLPNGVALVNQTGTYAMTPYITVAQGLTASQSVTVTLQVKNPSNVTLNLTPQIYSGSF